MISQDYKKHPGSVIKNKKDGEPVLDNPKFENKQQLAT